MTRPPIYVYVVNNVLCKTFCILACVRLSLSTGGQSGFMKNDLPNLTLKTLFTDVCLLPA